MDKNKAQMLISKLEKQVSSLQIKLEKLIDADKNKGKYNDKKIRLAQAKINYFNAEISYLNAHLEDSDISKTRLIKACQKEKIELDSVKSSRNIRYIKPDMVESTKQKISDKIVANEAKIEKLKEKYQTLVLKKNEGHRVRIERIVKISKKIEKTITKNKRNHINLELCDKLEYEVMNFYQNFKFWFSQIEYNKQKTIWGLIFLIPFFIGIGAFFLPSLVKTFYWSLYEIRGGVGGLKFTFTKFTNFIFLFEEYTIDGNKIFKVDILNFAKSLALDLPIILIFSLIIAVLLNTKFKGSLIVKAIFFIPVVFNFTLISTSISSGIGAVMEENMNTNMMMVENLTAYLMKINIGTELIEFIISAVDRIFTIVNLSGIQILVFTAALQSIPSNLYEAAKVEGCNKYETFWKITFPMVSPMLLTCAIYTVIDSFMRSPIFRYLEYSQVKDMNFGLTSAIAVVFLGINLVVIGLVLLLLKGLVFYYDKR